MISATASRVAKLLMAIIMLPILTGCWNDREIEDLSVYVGLGLDVAKESKFEQSIEQQGGDYPRKRNFTATVQVMPIGWGGQGQQGSQQNAKIYENEELTGDSMLQLFRQYSLRRDRPLIGHHLKVIIISTQIARKFQIDQLVEFPLRDNDVRPSCLVLVSDGPAGQALITREPGAVPAIQLGNMVKNVYRTNKILPPMTLTKLDARLKSGTSFLLQNVITHDGEHEFSGAAVFSGKTHKYIGNMNQEDMEGLSWIQHKNAAGTLKTYNEAGYVITYEIKKTKSTIQPTVRGDDISFHIKVDSEGWLMEDWMVPEHRSEGGNLREAEKMFAREAEQQLRKVLYKMQHTYKVDVGGFGEQLRIHYPKAWKRVKKDWDRIFSEVPITYEIQTTITNPGSSTE